MHSKTAQLFHKNVAFKAETVSDDGSFNGYGSVFGNVDSYGEIVAPKAFTESLKRIKESGDPLPALWQHQSSQPIGGYDLLEEDDRGLKVAGWLMIDSIPQAAQAHALMKRRVVKGMSIGYYVEDSSYNEKTGIRTLNKLDLQEISIVTFPANVEAQVEGVKQIIQSTREGKKSSLQEFETFLRDAGWTRKEAAVITGHGLRELLAQRDAEGKGSILDAMRPFTLPQFSI